MSVPVEINPTVLAWLGQQISSKADAYVSSLLDRWITNKEKPTTKTIHKMSQRTHIPFGYFFLNYPPEEECDLVHCRTIDSTKNKFQSREFIDTYNKMLNIQSWMSDYKHNTLELAPLPFVGRCTADNTPIEIATDIRQELELPKALFAKVHTAKNYFNLLREKISNSGILVLKNTVVGNNTKRKLDIKEFRAFTIIDKYAPLIFINGNDTENGKIFSLIHELAHIWLGLNDLFNDNYSGFHVSRIEQKCNAVASEILVPKSFFEDKWNSLKCGYETKISELAEVFHCSEIVIARRALDLKLIKKETYVKIQERLKKAFETLQSTNNKKSARVSFYNRIKSNWDRNFILALDYSTKSGSTPYLDAYRLTGLKSETFHELVTRLNQG